MNNTGYYRLILFLAFLYAGLPTAASCEQMKIFDKIVEHTGDNRLYSDWDFVTKMFFTPYIPHNWLEPVNYADGRYHIRIEIMSMGETDIPMKIMCGWKNKALVWDPTGQHCTISITSIKKPGVYGKSAWLINLWHGPAYDTDPVLPWDFEEAYLPLSFFTIVSPDPLWTTTNFDPFPLKMRLTLWLVSEGNWWKDDMTMVRDDDRAPSVFTIKQNYPNPFNPETTIGFFAPPTDNVNLSIYNVMGQKARTLVEHKVPDGIHRVVWDGKSDDGIDAASGIYCAMLKTSRTTLSQRMLLMR